MTRDEVSERLQGLVSIPDGAVNSEEVGYVRFVDGLYKGWGPSASYKGCDNAYEQPMVEININMFIPISSYDPVSLPKHYQLIPEKEVEVKDVRDVLLDKIQENNALTYRQADYWSRAWEYQTRFMDKNGLEDLKKAKVYLDWLIADIEAKNEEAA